MARSPSPSLPLRQTPSIGKKPIYVDDFEDDELAGDTIPCSPGAVLRHNDNNTTQPTQVLPQPQLVRSSSPASVVEVPASSPFQQPPKRPLGSRLAPPGTIFRPPPKPTVPAKRPSAESIDLISDDEDDEDDDSFMPPRGDIRPTTFKTQVAAFAYNPEQDRAKKMREKMRQIYDIYREKFSPSEVRKALEINDLDLERACDWLADRGKQPKPEAKMMNKRRLVSKSQLQASKPSSARDSPTLLSSSPVKAASPLRTESPSPVKQKQPRRRLVQGLRNPSTPTPKKTQAVPPSSDDPLVIDLVDNDKEDAYQAEGSPTSDDHGDAKVLNSINTSTLKELAAMTGLKEALLEPILAKRPFADLRQARKVSNDKKTGRKSSRDSIGQTVVDSVEVFFTAVESIDKVVEQCEKKARLVKEVMDTWDVNSFGHNKLSARNSPSRDDDLPMTPTSITSTKLCRPPIAKQPDYMDGHCQMKPFQLFGLNWMSLLHNHDIGCILADEMGLGKTCQVISFISHLVESCEHPEAESRPWPNLIIVPPSTYNNWLAEFEKFAPELSVIGYRGSQSERAEIAYEVEQAPEEYHVVLGTYSQVNGDADIEALNSMGIHAAIFDEGHKMKNPETKIYRELRRVHSDWKMLLTGTPVQNNLLEMTSLLNFINPKMFEGYMEHIKYIFSTKVTIRDVSNGAFLYSERVKRARTILEPFILQRRKDQVLSDMPKKINSVVYCDMTEGQKPVYDEYETTFKMEPSQRAAKAKTTAAAVGRGNDQNNVWMQLRKAAIHPLLFRRHFNDRKVEKMGKILMDNLDQSELHQPNLGHLIQELKNASDFELHLWCRDYPPLLGKFDYPLEAELDSGKVKKLLELIDQYQKNGDRVLVFSKFSRVLELVREVLALKNIDHRVLMGNTNVAERQDMIDEFNDDPSIPVFLLTTGAGGTGINLTSANKVIIFDQSDNPQDDIQAENRAHRLGQKRDVEVIRLISRGTLEELIHKACQKKIELANKVTGAVEEDAQEAAKNLEKEVRKMMEEEKMTPPQEG